MGASTPRLTAAQQELWLLAQENPDDPAYNVPFALWVDGPLDVDGLTRALDAVIARHDSLRTVISSRSGEPCATVLDSMLTTLPVRPVASETEALAAAARLSAAPFAGGTPLLRACLYRLGPDRHLLVMVLHHMICDGASLWILLEELTACYGAETRLEPAPQQTVAEAADAQAHAQRVAERIHSAPDVMDLPYDLGAPEAGLTAGAILRLPVPADLNEALERTARELGVTANAVVLAACTTVLEVLTGADDMLISVPVSRRRTPREQRVIGYLVHSVPMRLRPGACATASELVAQCASELEQAWVESGASFGEVVAQVGPKRLPGLNPLCQCEFSTQTIPDALPRLGECELRYQYVHNGGFKTGLSFEVVRHGVARTVAVEYPADLFLPTTVQRIARLLLRVLQRVTDRPASPLHELQLLAARDRTWLAQRSGAASEDAAQPPSLETRIDGWITGQPDAVALVDAVREVSYGHLGTWSDEVREALRAAGVRRGDRVALYGERACDFVVATVAVLRMGASFIALADDLPAARVAGILDATKPAVVVVTSPALAANLPATVRSTARPCPAGLLASGPGRPVAHPGEAYVVLTSGSTGAPRGVSVPQTALATVTAAWGPALDLLRSPGRHLQLAPFSFDVFVGDLARALGYGGTLVLAEREQLLEPARLLDLMARERTDTGEFVPAVIRLLMDYLDRNEGRLPLRRMMVGSDVWSVDEARALCRLLPPDAELHCTYGTSEATIDSTWYRVEDRTLPTRGTVPIGTPLMGTQVSVRDRRGRVVPPGFPGELWIGGPTVGAGYLDEETSRPVRVRGFTADGWYRTGDRAIWGRTGDLSLLGRLDSETKVRGVRVNPEEVESVLRAHPAVRAAAVVATEAEPDRRQLAAFVVGPADTDEVVRHARARLPATMVPAIWHLTEQLPLTRNGKVDRRTLARQAAVTESGAGKEPAGHLEETVAGIWCEVLGLATVGPLDDFFALGGSSVQAARLAWRIAAATGLDATVADILGHPSVRDLCHKLRAGASPAHAAADSLLEDLYFGPPPVTAASCPPRSVVLTGATGVLGAGILERLLATTNCEVLCLVRAQDPEQARRRIREALERQRADPTTADDPRLTVCPADLTAAQAGLGSQHLDRVLQADAIVNAAAWVNFLYPYEKLAPVNVHGVVTLARMASSVRAKPLHHLSTRSALPAPGERLRGGYNLSKAAGDAVLRKLADAGSRTCLYRPGFVLGHQETRPGRPGLLESFVRECLRLGRVPELPGHLDVVSVDHVARTVVGNVLSERPASRVELSADPPLPWSRAWELLRARGLALDLVSPAQWIKGTMAERSGVSWFEPFLALQAAVPLTDLLNDSGAPREKGATRASESAEQVWQTMCDQLLDVIQPAGGPG
ncbi:AMP-binding protein [Streptomyces sp. BK205]|uniref:non-ribosomal peptide synthetase n=1 Tax=Streptomyces sp. BK205 TaxID=2512164 RepID=UPI0010531E57|nr:AMP-binding protein [Streptomyces sp. BK205]TCR16021.1 amino acid adenylation domain-containing protein/thioester reductase-like protein [Streptomyces sp. BK205]